MKKTFSVLLFLCFLTKAYPQQTIGLFQNDSLAYEGYTLFAPLGSMGTYLIDNCGLIVNSWISNYTPGSSVYLLENGNLLRTGRTGGSFHGGGIGGHLEIRDWDDNLVWEYDYKWNNYHQHHDVEPLPNGNILVLAWESRSSAEAIAQGRNPATAGSFMWPERIVELQPVGTDQATVVWQWHIWDHLVQDFDSTKPNYGVIADHPELLDLNYGLSFGQSGDWIHANAIDYNPRLDQIVISSRYFNEFWVIDHSTTTAEAASHLGGNSGKGGDILYRWGNPIVYQRGTTADQKLFGQHDVQWIADSLPGAGNILIFNNGLGRPGGSFSTIDEITPPLDTNGYYIIGDTVPYGPDTLTWNYTAAQPLTFFSHFISGTQRLPNGNTLICAGSTGTFTEVDSLGNMHWRYITPTNNGSPISQGTFPNDNTVFRANRYSKDYAGFTGKTLIPGLPIELNPLNSACFTTPTQEERQVNNVRLIQNPVFESMRIENPKGVFLKIQLFDLTGRLVLWKQTANTEIHVNTTQLPNGIYILRISDENGNLVLKQKVIKL